MPSIALANESGESMEATEPAKILVIDRIEPQPGEGKAFLNEYLEVFAPVAQAVGSRLVDTRVAPPVWLETASNTLEFVWEVDGIPGCWAIASGTRAVPEIVEWWASVRARVVSHDRSFFAPTDALEELANV